MKMPLGTEVGLGPGDFVLDRDPLLPSQKGGGAPKFSARVYCGQTARWIKMVLGTEAGLSPGDFVLDGDPAPSQKGAKPPSQKKFSAHVYCGQMAGWIKMALSKEVGLSACELGTQPPLPKKGAAPPPPIFGLCLLRPNGSMDQDATWYSGRPRHRQHCVRWGPSSPPQKWGRGPLRNFRLMCIVANRLDGRRRHLLRK